MSGREERRLILRQFLAPLLLLTVEIAIFLVVFSLYRLEMEAVLYAGGLCLLLQLAVFGYRLHRLLQSRRQARQFLKAGLWDCSALPAAHALSAADAGEIIEALCAQVRELQNALRDQQQDSLDYYTTWVHQIKTPIAALSMLLNREDTEESRAMQAELFRIEQYVSLALNYVRLDGGRNDLVLRSCPVDDVIRAAIRKYAPLIVRKRLHLRYEPTALTVVTDEKWLQFILEQLLSNAVKYTPSGTITIAVRDSLLTVADTGIGIAPEDLPRIFERGFTGCNGRVDKKATGLGLYLSRRAANLLSFPLTASSTPGEGSSFTLNLRQQTLQAD